MKNIVRLIVIAVTLMGLGVVVERAAAEENFPDSPVDVGSCPAAFIHLHRSTKACFNWATWKVRTSLLSAGMRMDRWTAFPNSRPNSRISL